MYGAVTENQMLWKLYGSFLLLNPIMFCKRAIYSKRENDATFQRTYEIWSEEEKESINAVERIKLAR